MDNVVLLSDLPSWQELGKTDEHEVEERGAKTFRIKVDLELNSKLKLWQGDIRRLSVDAIVSPTNETMLDRAGISGQILEAAGPELHEEIDKTEQCRTDLFIHTVGPRYNEKYRTAAENALHGCYRSSLTLLKENNLTTIAFPLINSQKRGYPPDAGAHIAIRTVRRFLEHWGKGIDNIVFCMGNAADLLRYQKMLPLYFPRNYQEELFSKEELPRDIGNEFGETVIEERKIRISAFPAAPVAKPATPPTSLSNSSPAEIPADARPKSRAPDPNGKSSNLITKQHVVQEFGAMRADVDDEKRRKISALSKEEIELIENQQMYQQWLNQARKMDLANIARLSIIYLSGKDSHGRPIVVIIGNRLPQNNRAVLDSIFMYFIRLLDPIVNKDYVVVYLHTGMEDREKPDFSWLQKAYKVLDPRYGRSLKQFYIVHPTFWLKVAETLVSAFMVDDSFWTKVKYIEHLRELFTSINHDQIVIPEDIHKFDYQEFGAYYSTLQSKSTTAAEAYSTL